MTACGLSVIMPCFNGARFLAGAVDTVRRQTALPESYRIIVIDDSSTDDSVSVAQNLGEDVVVLQRPNGGPAAARNTGLEHADSEFIAFLDVDDLWPANKLELQFRAFEDDPDLDICLGLIGYQTLDDRELPDIHFGPQNSLMHVHLGSGLYRRRAFERVGHFNPDLRFHEDHEWLLRARELSLNIRIIRQVTLQYQLHDSNMTLDLPNNMQSLVDVMKHSLDRRRAAQGQAGSMAKLSDHADPETRPHG